MEAQEGRPGSPQATSYLTWQAQSQAFEHLVAYNRGRRELTGRGEPELLESLTKFGKGARVDERKQFVIEGLTQGAYKVRLQAYDTATGDPIKIPSTEQMVTIAGNSKHEITLVLDLTKKEDNK
jgi:hypothetical protein